MLALGGEKMSRGFCHQTLSGLFAARCKLRVDVVLPYETDMAGTAFEGKLKYILAKYGGMAAEISAHHHDDAALLSSLCRRAASDARREMLKAQLTAKMKHHLAAIMWRHGAVVLK